jgi:hypothetical protein
MESPTSIPAGALRGELRWNAPRHPSVERGVVWYSICGVIVVSISIYGILSGAWTLALVSILCGALYFLVHDHKLPDSTCVLTQLGVEIDGIFLPWTALKGFWFVRTPSYTEIRFTPKSTRTPLLTIQLGTVAANDIRAFLSGTSIELVDQKEGILDIFSRFAKL